MKDNTIDKNKHTNKQNQEIRNKIKHAFKKNISE